MNHAAAGQEVVFWKMVSEDLRIDIVAPFDVVLSDGAQLRVAALVKNFGPPRGMLVAFAYDTPKPYVQKIIEDGYGYSAQLGNSPEGYNRATMLDILKDWGWSGPEDRRPSWLMCGAE
jgi:hypothetical protein